MRHAAHGILFSTLQGNITIHSKTRHEFKTSLSAEIMSYSKWTLLPSSSATWILPCLKDQFPGVFNQIKFRREAKIMTVMLVLAMLNLDGSSFPSLRWWRSDWPCTFAINWDCDSSHPSQTCKNASEMQLQIFGIHFICHIVSIPVVSS